ncbi:DUF2442 domain-containing protein [Cupriavidus sp. 2MCAB6]|uniref:DUF2442 domain-containing protein n=1 Tax=Cupriavidus sp. 2MCAB6 TaxID=3232981 RepID=UPI003F931318
MDPCAVAVHCDEASFTVDLSDGRSLRVPLAWLPQLAKVTPEQRQAVRISATGLHWDAIDEDVSVVGLLKTLARLPWQRR